MISQSIKRLSLLRALRQNAQMFFANRAAFGAPVHKQATQQSINPYSYQTLKANDWLVVDPSKKESEFTHKSNAEQLIDKVPVILVDSNIVRCLGGTEINAGHPQVFIMLDTRTPGSPQTCKYCGLRYAKNVSAHHH